MIREFSMFEGAVTWKESTAIKAKDSLPKKKLKKSWTGKVASTAPIPIKCLCASFSNPKTQEVKITHLTVSWASVIYNCTRKYMYFYSVWGEISLHHELSFLDEYKTDLTTSLVKLSFYIFIHFLFIIGWLASMVRQFPSSLPNCLVMYLDYH